MIYLSKKPSKKKQREEEEQVVQYEMRNDEGLEEMLNVPNTGVHLEDNRIYFYTDVNHKSVRELNTSLRRLDIELQMAQIRLNLPYVPHIELHISSPGGDALAGFAAVDAIRMCKSPVHTYVEGIAASAASVMSISGQKRFITKNSFMLIHQLSACFFGTHEKALDELENQKNVMQRLLTLYGERATMTPQEIESYLKHDLFFDAVKCKELGLVDEIL
jgi:ATP-dependent Clp protease protease subunit